MIQLTNETRIIQDNKFLKDKSLIGTKADNSLYLVRVDKHNLGLKRGETIENYFGDVRTALRKSLNYAVKGSETALSLEMILEQVKHMDKQIDELVI